MAAEEIPTYLRYALDVVEPWLKYKQIYERIPGISVGIRYRDRFALRAEYGFSDVEAQMKVGPETRFRIASISKVFTATAILQLAERGEIYLDMPVSSYLRWFSDQNEGSGLQRITVRHLLSHMAGITRDGSTPHWSNDLFPTREEIEAEVGKGISVRAPLEQFKYSNFGYTLLGRVIETVSGQSYADYINENILEPLKLSATTCDFAPDARVNLAKGYGRELPGSFSREEFIAVPAAAMAPAAGLIADASDLCRFIQALSIGSGLLLSDQSKREMRLGLGPGESRYGLGLQVAALDGHEVSTHIGVFAGFTSRVALDSGENIAIAVLTNANDVNVDALTYGILRTIWYFHGNQELYQSQRAENQNLNDYQGLYRGRWSDVQFVKVGDRLLGYNPKFDAPLLGKFVLDSQGNDRFPIADCDGFDYVGESIEFLRDEHGKVEGMRIGPYPLSRISLAGTASDIG
jgi:D-alanyl-D-alanine carboxypeptidase